MSSGPVLFFGRRVQASSPLPMNDQPASTDTANSTSEKPARASVRISVLSPPPMATAAITSASRAPRVTRITPSGLQHPYGLPSRLARILLVRVATPSHGIWTLPERAQRPAFAAAEEHVSVTSGRRGLLRGMLSGASRTAKDPSQPPAKTRAARLAARRRSEH